jgi:acyl-[acyl-carrier-protein]-phospholipid O-acyltransferase/long-chain-fatty-acid--[acyl-carrier-protein] ligase
LRAHIRRVLRVVFRVRITGDMKALEHGPRLVVAHCESALDGVLLGLLLPRLPLVATTSEMHGLRLMRWLSRWIRWCRVTPDHPMRLRQLVRHVKAGGVAVVFPQGCVTTNGTVMPTEEAAGMLAAHCGGEVVPVRVSGTLYSRYAATPASWPKRWFPQVTIDVCPAVCLADALPAPAIGVRHRCTGAIHALMQDLASRPPAACSLFDAFVEAVERHGRRTRIIEDARRQPESYGQLLKVSLALGRVLSRETVAGESVGVLLPSVSTTLGLVLGLTAYGRVAAMLNYGAGVESMRQAYATAGARTLITSRQFLAAIGLRDVGLQFEGARVIYLEELRQSLTLADKLWLVAYAQRRPRSAVPTVDPRQAAVVLFTSGSEGAPKGVVLSHDAMLANMRQLQSIIDFGPEDKFFSALPLYHIFGLVACSLMPLLAGTRVFVYLSPLHYRAIAALVGECSATYLFGTSTFLSHYARQARSGDFRSLRKVICGGEKLNAEVARLWSTKFGLRVFEGYGATECGPAMALNTPAAFKPDTVGRFLPQLEYRLLPVEGIAIGGALHVRGPNLMSGYLYPERPGVLVPPASAAGPGWHDTGDVVVVDSEGYVSVVGRTRRFVKIAGEMISLDAVERVAFHASPQHHHAAILAQVPAQGESTLLITTDPSLDRAALLRAARHCCLPHFAAARSIQHVNDLPLLGNGKTDYAALSTSLAGFTTLQAH